MNLQIEIDQFFDDFPANDDATKNKLYDVFFTIFFSLSVAFERSSLKQSWQFFDDSFTNERESNEKYDEKNKICTIHFSQKATFLITL